MYIGLFHIPMFLNRQPLSTAMKPSSLFSHHHSPWFSLMEIEEYTRVSQSQFATKGWVKTYEISQYDWWNNHPLTFWIFSMYEGFNTHVVLGTKLPPRLLKIPGWFWFNTSFLTHIPIWLVVWNMAFIFPYIGNFIIPTDFHIFQRGWNHQPAILGYLWY